MANWPTAASPAPGTAASSGSPTDPWPAALRRRRNRHSRPVWSPGQSKSAFPAPAEALSNQQPPGGPASRRPEEERLNMWVFLSARLRTWLLLAVALPLARLLVHRLAVAAQRRDPPPARRNCSTRPTRQGPRWPSEPRPEPPPETRKGVVRHTLPAHAPYPGRGSR